MDEILAYAVLCCNGLGVTEEQFQAQLDERFLASDYDEMLLEMECAGDAWDAMAYLYKHYPYRRLDREKFGKVLLTYLKPYYQSCTDIREFADRMFCLWEDMPWVQSEEPFRTLAYGDTPESWTDDARTRKVFEAMLDYYG